MEYNQFELTFEGKFMGLEVNYLKDGGRLAKLQIYVDGEILSFFFKPEHESFEHYNCMEFGDNCGVVCTLNKIPNANTFKLKFVRAS